MTIPSKILLSDLLNHSVRCSAGLDHGSGSCAWMHPPVHRLLGWVTKPSSFRMTREVWRLNQLKGISNQDLYVQGEPSSSDQATLDRFPTLISADLINNKGEKLGFIADFVFESKTGKILYYLIARTNPKIPGTSRWRLSISLIVDQQPGSVFSNIFNLDDLPIEKSSIRQDFIKRSQKWRSQLQDITFNASDKLEGWIDDQNWQNENNDLINDDLLEKSSDNWVDEFDVDSSENFNRMNSSYKKRDYDSDPWI